MGMVDSSDGSRLVQGSLDPIDLQVSELVGGDYGKKKSQKLLTSGFLSSVDSVV